MKKNLPANSGVTILELMIAIFIFSVTSYSLMQGLQAGDRIGGRAKVSQTAARLAANEAERVRGAALQGVQPRDSTYAETASGVRYEISRKIVDAPDADANAAYRTCTEFEITVAPQGPLFSPYVFKLVQGYNQ